MQTEAQIEREVEKILSGLKGPTIFLDMVKRSSRYRKNMEKKRNKLAMTYAASSEEYV
ncbi:hypothetical protein KAU87_04855 [Candidatus Bathyarchaeota archaeon]|nr:hypothetical protein [Candidatus Bathyarchaeota archaeon]